MNRTITTTTARPDAITLLTRDHRMVDQLFESYEQASDAEARAWLVRQMTVALSRHAVMEEGYFYPAIAAEVPGGRALADEAVAEHQELKEVLAALERLEPGTAAYDDRVAALVADVRHHVQEEEQQLFPALRQAVPHERLVQIGTAMEATGLIAPTHPHPRAPNRPPLNLLAGPLTGLLDRSVDLLRVGVASATRLMRPGSGR